MFAERLFDRGEHEPDEADLIAGIDVGSPALGSLTAMDDAGGSPDDLTLRAVRRRVVRLCSAATPSALRKVELFCFEKLDVAMTCLHVSGHGATSGRPAVPARDRAARGNLRVGRVSGRGGRKRVAGQRRLTTGERHRWSRVPPRRPASAAGSNRIGTFGRTEATAYAGAD